MADKNSGGEILKQVQDDIRKILPPIWEIVMPDVDPELWAFHILFWVKKIPRK